MTHIKIPLLCIAIASSIALSAHAWPGFTWEQWLKDSGESKPQLDTAQAGQTDLLPLLKTTMNAQDFITTTEQWESKRKGITNTLSQIIGTPSNIQRDTAPVIILGEERLEKYRRIHLRIPGEVGDPIPA